MSGCDPKGQLQSVKHRIIAEWNGDVHERLDRFRVLVLGVGHQRVERMPQTALSDDLEGSTAHPGHHVDLLRSVADTALNRKAKLRPRTPQSGELFLAIRRRLQYTQTHLLRDTVERRRHVAEVRDGEHGLKHPALLPVHFAARSEQSRPKNNLDTSVKDRQSMRSRRGSVVGHVWRTLSLGGHA